MTKVLYSSKEKDRVIGHYEKYIKPVDSDAIIKFNKEFDLWECLGTKMQTFVPVTITKE